MIILLEFPSSGPIYYFSYTKNHSKTVQLQQQCVLACVIGVIVWVIHV